MHPERPAPDIASLPLHDGEISWPVFSRMCPSGLNGPFLVPLWGYVLGVFIVQMGEVSAIQLVIVFIGVTTTSAN